MEEKKFRVLWLDDDFDPNSKNHKQMSDFMERGQNLYPFNIHTCITGNDFIELANSENGDWHVFILDIYGKMDIENNGEASDILNKVIEKTIVNAKKEGILLYCLTGNESMKNRRDVGMRNGYLKSLLFQKNPQEHIADNNQEEQYYYLKDDLIDLLFENMFDTLNSRRFKEYPEFDYLYRKVDNSGKRFIQGLYDWKMGKGPISTDFGGLREIRKKVEVELSIKGFFKRYPLLSNGGIKLITPKKLSEFINARFNTREAFSVLNDSCRSAWEALSIQFLCNSSDALLHPENFKEPENNSSQYNLYSDYFYPALFNSFVIFANWYKRFYEKFEKEEFDMNKFIDKYHFDSYMKQYDEQEKKYSGVIVLGDNSNNHWMIKPDSDVELKQSKYYIHKDDPAHTKKWDDGERVRFSIISIRTQEFAVRVEPQNK